MLKFKLKDQAVWVKFCSVHCLETTPFVYFNFFNLFKEFEEVLFSFLIYFFNRN